MGLLDRIRPGRSSNTDAVTTGTVLFTASRPPLLESDHLSDQTDVPASPPAEQPPAPALPSPAPTAAPRSIIDHQPVGGEPTDAADLLSAIASSEADVPSPAVPRPPTASPPVPGATPPALPPREPPEVEWSKAEHDEPEVYAFSPEADEPDGLLDHFADLLDGTGGSRGGRAA